jgi:hypothetical protein
VLILRPQSSEQVAIFRPQGITQKHGKGNQTSQTNQEGFDLVHVVCSLIKSKPKNIVSVSPPIVKGLFHALSTAAAPNRIKRFPGPRQIIHFLVFKSRAKIFSVRMYTLHFVTLVQCLRSRTQHEWVAL